MPTRDLAAEDRASQPRAVVGRVQCARPRPRLRRGAAAARARQVLLHLLVEPGRVLHGARRRPPRSGGGRIRQALRRRPLPHRGARGDQGARHGADGAAVEALEARAAAGARRRGHRDRHDRGVHAEGAAAPRGGVHARHLPGADAARGRLGPAVPVHLRAVALAGRARRRPGHGRGAIRPRQGAGGARPVRRCRASGSCRSSR